MQIEKRLQNHYRRWNINLDFEEEFLKFKHRLIEVLDQTIGSYLVEHSRIDESFFQIYKFHKAEEPKVKKSSAVYLSPVKSLFDDDPSMKKRFLDVGNSLEPQYTEKGFGDTNLYKLINDCEVSQELASTLQFFFWALEEYQETRIQLLSKQLVKEIRKVSLLTPSASFKIYTQGKRIIIYPHGDDFLDKGIIDYVLSGLEDYPEVAVHFEKALKIYQSGEISLYRNLLDNLRVALEQFMKKVISNNKPLEKQKEALEQWFRERGLHPQVLNLYKELLFNQYARYQNEAVKHNETFSLDEVEFMIYLTGNFIRLIIQLTRNKLEIEKIID